MAATNIFYRIPSQRGTRVASIAGTECTLDQFCNYIIDIEGLNCHDFIIASGTKVFRPSSCNLQQINLQNNSHIDILIPLLGGKGGFGSLLRAIGAQIEKTTNRDACRDLSGRRLRDIKRDEELRNLLELQEKLKEERKRRKKEKLENLRKKSEKCKTESSIQELVSMFDDHAYNKRRLELSDIIDAAVEKGLINSKKRQHFEDLGAEETSKRSKTEKVNHTVDACKSGRFSDDEVETNSTNSNTIAIDKSIAIDGHQRRKKTSLKNKTRKEDLWLGLEEEESDEVELETCN